MKKLLTTLALILSAFSFNSFAQTESSASNETRYTVILVGNRAGVATSTMMPNGELKAFFEFNDRGRGPKINSRIIVGAGSIPTLIETSGNDYLKAPVEERFYVTQGKAAWKNRAETGERALNGRAFYVSMFGTPVEGALLAKALLAAPNHKLSLLPEGEASIERVGELSVEANGRARKVFEYEISGLDFTPSPIWMDENGEYFASVSGWSSIILEGWETAINDLLKAQQAHEAARTEALARTLAHHLGKTLVIANANLFDSETAQLRQHMTVVINGNRITQVGPTTSVRMPHGAEVILASGKTLMPGLWDMHVHLGGIDGLMHMAAGVTSVRDLGNDSDQLLQMKKKFDEESAIGPRVLMACLVDGHGPYQGPTKVFVDTEEDARRVIDRFARLGYVQIKIYSSIKPELVPKIAELAHQKGLRVSGHVPAFMTAEQFVKAGADEIQHTNFLFLNFLFDTVQDTRTPARFTAVAQHAAELDLQSERVRQFIKLLQEHHTVVDPTVNVFEGMFVARAGTVSPDFAEVADRFPPQIRRGLLGGGLPVPDGMDERYRDSFAQMLRMVKLLYDSGITIVAGTDSMAGFSLHRELELYAQAGIPASKVLQIATLGAARVMKRDNELGSIKPGKLADLILVDGDPTERISDIRRVCTVVKNGTVYQTSALYQAIGVRPAR